MEIGTFGSLFQGAGWFVANFFVPNIWRFSIVLVNYILYTLQVMECCAISKHKGLNFCRDSYVGITKVEICVAWVMHFHLCLMDCVCFLLTCWLGCHKVSWGLGIIKMCVIQLQPRGEHMLSSWPLGSLCLPFSVKFYVKGYVPSHTCHYCHNELGHCDWCG
jgi:hypothetical protein